jgi:hypothetical protein
MTFTRKRREQIVYRTTNFARKCVTHKERRQQKFSTRHSQKNFCYDMKHSG